MKVRKGLKDRFKTNGLSSETFHDIRENCKLTYALPEEAREFIRQEIRFKRDQEKLIWIIEGSVICWKNSFIMLFSCDWQQ